MFLTVCHTAKSKVLIATSSTLRSVRLRFPKAFASVVCTTIFATFGAACSSGNSTPPESLLQSSLSELAANDAKGLVSFSNIRKLDGQLQPDGINYVMDYEARFTTNKCIEYKTYADGIQDIPLDVLEERSAKSQSKWCAENGGKFVNSGGGRFWGAGYTADITGQVFFTKKEKGWVLVKALLPLREMPGTGKLASKHDVSASKENYAYLAAKPFDELATNPEALRLGANIYAKHCATCHGAKGRGDKGIPDLTDNDWMWGTGEQQLTLTIMNGRVGVMPVLAPALGTDDDVSEMVYYVRSLSGLVDSGEVTQSATEAFSEYCGVCHQPAGTGDQRFGAPNLTDSIWLYGGSEADIRETITKGRNGMCRSLAGLPDSRNKTLAANRAKVVAAYVVSLAN